MEIWVYKKITEDKKELFAIQSEEFIPLPAETLRNLVESIATMLGHEGAGIDELNVHFCPPQEYTIRPGEAERCAPLNERDRDLFIEELKRWWKEELSKDS